MGKSEENVAKREGAEILKKIEEVGTLGRRKEYSEKKDRLEERREKKREKKNQAWKSIILEEEKESLAFQGLKLLKITYEGLFSSFKAFHFISKFIS